MRRLITFVTLLAGLATPAGAQSSVGPGESTFVALHDLVREAR